MAIPAALTTFACFTAGLGVGVGVSVLEYKHSLYRQRKKVFATVKEEIEQMDEAKRMAMKRKYSNA
jgi:hypothetical protein